MNKDEMLKRMCQFGLSQADIKAICKIRDLPPACLKSRDLFQHNFLNDTGIEKAMASLDERQTLFLHLLNVAGEETDIKFFTHLYKEAYPGGYGYTFNDKYKVVFNKVKTELIRKGLLLCAEDQKGWGNRNTTVLERQRFMFPTDFSHLLPLPADPVLIDKPGDKIERKDVLRDKLAEILETKKAPDPQSDSVQGSLHIKNGTLLLGKSLFTVKRLKGWNRSRWSSSVRLDARSGNSRLSPVEIISYALSFLKEREWAVPDDILPLWKIAYPTVTKLPDIRSACEKGWKYGCLEKTTSDGKTFYRLLRIDTGMGNRKPEDFLSIKNDDFIEIDLSCIPLDTLERLCGTCNMSIRQGRLTFQPDLVKISHASEEIREAPTFVWLQKHHQAFTKIVRAINKREGKTVVHNNLMIARIRDLSLKVLLEKKFTDTKQVVSLSEEFISFPVNLLPEIQKVVTKSGHAVKFIDANDND
ncbi:MAG: hypothetical protein JRF30_02375 [Deltaproteobacteria bacterium]|nr:hypothetical protein [Deltaproteobacteria bacterium]MBW1794487.1 hypothetical protein [Deltaproteobacteria bacterium]MBW2329785.1 hypothetical protein [Deltaproteobacteria bacterium]